MPTRTRTPEVVDADRLEVHQYAGTAAIVDLRDDDERHATGWIAGAVHVPTSVIEEQEGLAPGTTILVCSGGATAGRVARRLRDGGHDVGSLDGGMQAWIASGRPVVGLAHWHTTAPRP